MRNVLIICSAIIISLALSGCANNSRLTNTKTKLKLRKDVSIPNATSIAIYMPENSLTEEIWANDKLNKIGKALKEATEASFNRYFTDVSWFEHSSNQKANLYIKILPNWKRENQDIVMTFKYTLYDAQENILKEGSSEKKTALNLNNTDAVFFNVSYKTMEPIIGSILNSLLPTPEKFATAYSMKDFNTELLINNEKPIRTGTGFYINKSGDLLTAQHVIDKCMSIKVSHNGETLPVEQLSDSKLLDLAVLTTNKPTENYLPLRSSNELTLGEKIITVSYPLNGLLASSANITFGNITSQNALSNSLGLYQFSAPIQPGSSGGAIVSELAEVIGVVTSTLNIKSLVKDGVIPQNVNFALKPHLIKKFLDKNEISYVHRKASNNTNETALKTALQIACYQ